MTSAKPKSNIPTNHQPMQKRMSNEMPNKRLKETYIGTNLLSLATTYSNEIWMKLSACHLTTAQCLIGMNSYSHVWKLCDTTTLPCAWLYQLHTSTC